MAVEANASGGKKARFTSGENKGKAMSANPSGGNPDEAVEALGSAKAVKAAHATKMKFTLSKLHRCLGHISPAAAGDIVRLGMVEGINLDMDSKAKFCVPCARAKAVKRPFPKQRKTRSTGYGERVFPDVWSPAQVETIGGNEYYVTLTPFTDDSKRETKLYIIAKKSDAFNSYLEYEVWVFQHRGGAKIGVLEMGPGLGGATIGTLDTDRRGEYLSKEFTRHLKAKGTVRCLNVHDSPQQEGVAERLNQTLLEHARAMLIAARLPKFLWGEEDKHAAWLKDRVSTRALVKQTPYEAATGESPDLSDIHEFGCKAWVRQENTKKLDDRALEGRFVGFDEESKGYRIYWPRKWKVTVERNVKFNPDEILVGDIQSEGEKVDDAVIVQDIPADQPDPAKIPEAQEAPASQPEQSEHSDSGEDEEPVLPRRQSRHDGLIEPAPNTGRGHRAHKATNYADLHHGRARASAAVEEKHRHPEIEFSMASCGSPGAEPRTAQEALNSPQSNAWAEAMEEEINQLEKANAWEIVKPPPKANVLRSRCVFRTKHDSNEINRYRARFVAKGNTQVYGIDYTETFAPVVKLSTLRVILVLAAQRDCEIHHMDVKSAYLNTEIKETVSVQPPHGYLEGKENHQHLKKEELRSFALLLKKALYGTQQGARRWYKKLAEVMKAF
jgi:hypothetical protein